MAKNLNPPQAPQKPVQAPKVVEAATLPATVAPAPALVVPANAALIEWPTDVWGLTKDLKKAVVFLASRIGGHADKKELADRTIAIALAHIESKFDVESKSHAKKIARLTAEAEAEADNQIQLF